MRHLAPRVGESPADAPLLLIEFVRRAPTLRVPRRSDLRLPQHVIQFVCSLAEAVDAALAALLADLRALRLERLDGGASRPAGADDSRREDAVLHAFDLTRLELL